MRLFVQPFIRPHIKETWKSALLALCEGNSPVTGDFPHKGSVKREKTSISWRHHERRISDTYAIAMLRNDRKDKYDLMFLKINWARQGLNICDKSKINTMSPEHMATALMTAL